MTTPTQDRDITATLSAPREEPTAGALEAAAARLLASASKHKMDYLGDDWRVIDGNDGTYPAAWCWMSRHHECSSDRMLSARLDYPTAQAAAVDLLRHHPELWPAEPDETAPDHWATIRAALAPGATDDARAAAMVAVDALSTQEDR